MTKQLLLIASVMLSVTGCVESSPIRIINFYSPDPTQKGVCENSSTVGLLSGTLDMAGSGAYVLGMTVTSDLDQIVTNSGAGNLINGDGNNFIVDEKVLTYTSLPALPFEKESLAIAAVIPPNTLDSQVVTNIVGPKAAELLRAQGDKVSLKVSIQFRGTLQAGGRMTSAPITFPITVFQTTRPNCGANGFLVNGPCGGIGGQDGAPIQCCTGGPMDTETCLK